MSNIVPFEAGSGTLVVPAHLAAIFGVGNLNTGESIPHLSTKGKVWKIVKDGNETPLMTKNDDGDEFPTPSVKVVVLDTTPGRSRTFYKGTYTEGSNAKPTCHSYDGVKPASDVEEAQCTNCQACEHSVKGSKISDQGVATTACAPNKMLAVVPSNKLDFSPLRLRLAITSIYDKENPEEAKGWYAWDQYVKFLKSRGVTHTAMVETTMKFDSSSAYPKILFRASGMLSEQAMIKTAELTKSDEVRAILGLDKGTATEVVKITKKAEVVDDGFGATDSVDNSAEEVAKAETAKKEAEAKAAKAAKAKAKKEAEEKAAKEAAEAKALADAKATVVDEADDSLAAALASWDD